jgi:hypothetical protein
MPSPTNDRATEVRPSDDDYSSKRTGIRRLMVNAEGALSEMRQD